MSNRLVSRASKVSISSSDVESTEESLVEGRDGCMGIGEGV